MVQRTDDSQPIDGAIPPEADDEDERLGEAIEAYLALAEQDQAPDPEEFVGALPDLKDDLRAALEGLELVHGLVGAASRRPPARRGARAWIVGWNRAHRIAGYRVVRELGRGGMGTVYEAVHVGLDRPVALKVLGTHAAPDSSARRRFLNEARTAAGLHHTHIVPVFDVGQVGGLCYYAMQRIEGSGLDRVVRHLRRTRPAAGSGERDRPRRHVVHSERRSGGPGLLVVQLAVRSALVPGLRGLALAAAPASARGHPRRRDRAGTGADAPPSHAARSGREGHGVFPSTPASDSTASWEQPTTAMQRPRRVRGPTGSLGLDSQPGVHRGTDPARTRSAATTSRRRSIRRAARPISGGSPRSGSRRPTPWRTPITRE